MGRAVHGGNELSLLWQENLYNGPRLPVPIMSCNFGDPMKFPRMKNEKAWAAAALSGVLIGRSGARSADPRSPPNSGPRTRPAS